MGGGEGLGDVQGGRGLRELRSLDVGEVHGGTGHITGEEAQVSFDKREEDRLA